MYKQQLQVWGETLRELKRIAMELVRLRPNSAGWAILLEYIIPRRMSRIDLVVLVPNAIIPVEIKYGMNEPLRSALWQVEDYALDLRDYHAASHDRLIAPILVATARRGAAETKEVGDFRVPCCNWSQFAGVLLEIDSGAPKGLPIDVASWSSSAYRPTPTIVQAARAVFDGHRIAGLSHTHAEDLNETVSLVEQEVENARKYARHTIVFVTGVPGAGKTLAGLSAAQSKSIAQGEAVRAVFLSGNLPLTRVLQAALARDAVDRGLDATSARRRAKDLVQLVHKFVDQHIVRHPGVAPIEHVVVYDEAQRAWNAKRVARFHEGLDRSEPALMLDIMQRQTRWSVIVAVVGGGQEIHTGEAGIAEWGRALAQSGVPWRIVASPEALEGGDAVAGQSLFSEPPSGLDIHSVPGLHLRVSTRSPRAQYISRWVNRLLAGDAAAAAEEFVRIRGFRMAVTRELATARQWLRDASRDELRPGLVASSGALRHRAYGLELDSGFLRPYPIDKWFLSGRSDVRSSHQLEVAMREFDIQGLELDYVGVCWGDDLTRCPDDLAWNFRAFRGTKWQIANGPERQQYLLNKYRVLLTRAREGLIVWVPRGDAGDPTREPARMDRTADYLIRCGLPLI